MIRRMSHRETMSSRERVLTAINHQVPDRVPIDLGGFQTGIHKGAYVPLLKHLGIEDRVGSVGPGKDADLAIWDGDPLDARSRVRYTIIDGETVYSA